MPDPAQRRRIARKAAYARHAQTLPSPATTAAARATFEARFMKAARAIRPPDATEEEVTRTAYYLRRVYFQDLANRSVKARQRKAHRGVG